MIEQSFFSFLNKVKTGKERFPVTIMYGYNEFLGETVIGTFCKTFIEKKNDFNYRRYYFDNEDDTSWEEVVDEARSSSFFIQSRKIIVATIREEKKLTLSKSDAALLKEYIDEPNNNTLFVIFFSLNVMKDDFKQIKKLKIDKFLKELESPNTQHVDLDKITHQEFSTYIHNYLKASGVGITANALDRIVEIKDDDFISVLHQLPKLAMADVQDRSIDSEDIDKIITGVEAHSIWDLTDAIEAEDVGKYLRVLKYLLMNGIKPTLIIGTLITHYNKLFIAKFLLNHHTPAAEIGKVLGQHAYFLTKFINSARAFSERRLEYILKMIYKLDYESKTSGESSARLSLQNFAFRVKLLSNR